MADNYRLCPCGSGKKVKFCCQGMATDIDAVVKLLESDQRAAAVQKLDSLIAKHGAKTQLLNLKVIALIESERFQEAEEVVLGLLQADPDAARPYALAAILDVVKGKGDAAVAQLQQALERADDEETSVELLDAISMVAISLAQFDGGYRARAHLALWVAHCDEEAVARPFQMLMELDHDLHPLLQSDIPWFEPPEDADWGAAYEQAQERSARGAWLAAAKQIDELARAHPDEPRLRRVHAFVLGRACAAEELTVVMRDFGKLEQADFDDRVEAEAIAQLLEGQSSAVVDQIRKTIDVQDPEIAMEALLSHSQSVSLDPSRFVASDGAPPPKGMFLLLDSEAPSADEACSLQNTPVILGQVALFGRQTDRSARVELVALDNGDLESSEEILRTVIQEELGQETARETAGQQLWLRTVLSRSLFISPTADAQQRDEIRVESLRNALFEIWPTEPNPQLGGKTPEEAAKDPELKIPLAAALLLVEQAALLGQWRFDTNPIRQRLGIPEIRSEELTDLQIVHRTQYDYINVAKLDDEQLKAVIQAGVSRARQLLAIEAVREALNRGLPERDASLSVEGLYELLGRWVEHPTERRKLIAEAKSALENNRKAVAPWLVRELVGFIEAGDGEQARSLLNRLTSEYAGDETVMRMVMQVLSQFGLLPGPSVGGPQEQPQAVSAADIAVQKAKEAPSSGLWTPDGPPPAETEEKSSKLWVPGMD